MIRGSNNVSYNQVVKVPLYISHVYFLRTIVAPKLFEHFGADQSNHISDVLALSILWACHGPLAIAHAITRGQFARSRGIIYMIHGSNNVSYNPVVKVPLYISYVDFLRTIVTPKLFEHFGADQSDHIADVLSLSILWAYHDPSLSHMLSQEVNSRVQEG
jgi:hypothetical protein